MIRQYVTTRLSKSVCERCPDRKINERCPDSCHLGDYDKAEDSYNKSLSIFTEVYSSTHPLAKSVQSGLDALRNEDQ